MNARLNKVPAVGPNMRSNATNAQRSGEPRCCSYGCDPTFSIEQDLMIQRGRHQKADADQQEHKSGAMHPAPLATSSQCRATWLLVGLVPEAGLVCRDPTIVTRRGGPTLVIPSLKKKGQPSFSAGP